MRLDHSNWVKHLPRHPEVAPYHDSIPLALTAPGLVIEMPHQERHYYRLGLGEGRYEKLYLRVIVGAHDGRIRTVHFVRSVDLADGTVVHMEPGG